jgi:(R)-amidase
MARAQENQAFAVMVNRVGDGDEGLVFAGGSAAVDPFGRTLFEAGRAECRQVVELDLDLLRTARHEYDYLGDRRLFLTGDQSEHDDGRRELLIP